MTEQNSQNKYTPEGLPVLTRATIDMYFIEEDKLDRETDGGLMKVMETRAREIFGKNPVLAQAIGRFCKEYSCKGMDAMLAQTAGVFVYELLKRQAEVNKLEE
jgi:hypothetical protein